MNLQKVIEGLETIIAALKEADKPETVKEQPKPEEKKTEPKVTLEELRAVLAQKSSEGKGSLVRELLKKHGAEKLSALNESEYASVKAEAENL